MNAAVVDAFVILFNLFPATIVGRQQAPDYWRSQSSARFAESNNYACALPTTWNGNWYEEGERLLVINGTHFGWRGRCVESSRNMFLIMMETSGRQCWSCLIIFQKHANVLQWKQTTCGANGTLEEVCDRIFGDSLMSIAFRVDGKPYACPVTGPFNFTYSSYRSHCTTRSSMGELCASRSILRLYYQACPESYASETKVEDIQCYGSWISDGRKYFAGRLLGRSSFREMDNFRCFIYETRSNGGSIGISADSSCAELTDLENAVNRINYTEVSHPAPSCEMSQWLAYSRTNKSRRRSWLSLKDERVANFTDQEFVIGDSGDRNHTVGICIERENFGSMTRLIVYAVQDCDHGFQCVKIYKRSSRVIEIVRGFLAPTPYVACMSEYFQPAVLSMETFIDAEATPQKCPHKGVYQISGCGEDESTTSIGCDDAFGLIAVKRCDGEHSRSYECMARWNENPWHYLILREPLSGRLSCALYTESDNAVLNMSKITQHACPQTVLFDKHTDFVRFKIDGVCGAAVSMQSTSRVLSVGAVGVLVALVNNYRRA